MRFSIWPSSAHSWDAWLRMTSAAEASGWDGVWVADHFMRNTDDAAGDMQECFSLLAGLAAAVPRLQLGSLVAGNTYRHPAVLANQARTIDHISNGRLTLGMGAGWQRNEHEAYGIDLPPTPELLARFEEACQVVRGLRDEDWVTFDGEYYQLAGARLDPKPVGALPLLIGAAGEKVMPRIVAQYADQWNTWGTPERFAHKSAIMTRACEVAGRDPATLGRSTQALLVLDGDGPDVTAPVIAGGVQGIVDAVGAFSEAGLDELIVPDFHLESVEESMHLWDTVIGEVAPHFRD
ncbi:TIGR03560 family F420-dependent LLM class oxidoreductase [Luteipulveratus mongoliensis]|uniref:Luciferase n=1 Tax=Luteipulveratus mongoliensis TaxID=571913 RepID=A0A0K1JG89_9MICO|nr:TIGR03560 family F420-dependent LLM class oxidoreductase [Luteipulveratus mongoliensis]AKU15714.1 luciferase [Luteipulveratus mongoliensis]